MTRKNVPPFQHLHREMKKKNSAGWLQGIDDAFFSCGSNACADAPTGMFRVEASGVEQAKQEKSCWPKLWTQWATGNALRAPFIQLKNSHVVLAMAALAAADRHNSDQAMGPGMLHWFCVLKLWMLAGSVAGLGTQTAEHKDIPFKKRYPVLYYNWINQVINPRLNQDVKCLHSKRWRDLLQVILCQYVPRQMPVQFFRNWMAGNLCISSQCNRRGIHSSNKRWKQTQHSHNISTITLFSEYLL